MNDEEKEVFENLLRNPAFVDLSNWVSKAMPIDSLGDGANQMMGSILGACMDGWLNAGADPEVLKEYFSRFVDMCVELRTPKPPLTAV